MSWEQETAILIDVTYQLIPVLNIYSHNNNNLVINNMHTSLNLRDKTFNQ